MAGMRGGTVRRGRAASHQADSLRASRAAAATAEAWRPSAGSSVMREVEEMIILLLGSHRGPIPSGEHLQKEMFLMVRSKPRLVQLFRFEGHRTGPYSARLDDAAMEPLHYGGAYYTDGRGQLRLTGAGRRAYDDMFVGSSLPHRLDKLACAASLGRHIYDKMTVDELLFVLHDTYPEHTKLTGVRDKYGPAMKRHLADSLLKDAFITPERYGELIGSR